MNFEQAPVLQLLGTLILVIGTIVAFEDKHKLMWIRICLILVGMMLLPLALMASNVILFGADVVTMFVNVVVIYYPFKKKGGRK